MIIKSLLKKKQDKVEEIKKKTGYYSTRDLLEKYDEALKNTVSPARDRFTTISSTETDDWHRNTERKSGLESGNARQADRQTGCQLALIGVDPRSTRFRLGAFDAASARAIRDDRLDFISSYAQRSAVPSVAPVASTASVSRRAPTFAASVSFGHGQTRGRSVGSHTRRGKPVQPQVRAHLPTLLCAQRPRAQGGIRFRSYV